MHVNDAIARESSVTSKAIRITSGLQPRSPWRDKRDVESAELRSANLVRANKNARIASASCRG